MKAIKLLQNNTEVTKRMIAWFTNKMNESFVKETPEEIKIMMLEKGISLETLGIMIDENSRMLFDFFDEHHVYITTPRDMDSGRFKSLVNDEVENFVDSRKEAELKAIEMAFEQLELILKTKT